MNCQLSKRQHWQVIKEKSPQGFGWVLELPSVLCRAHAQVTEQHTMSGQCTQPSKPDEEELKINLGWKEGFSQRFHRLSPAALDKAIASLLAVQYQRGRQAPLDISNGDMQKLCSAARCVSITGSRHRAVPDGFCVS